ncbi:triggering receptor expressed on myeloid cells 2 [Spea bombifrons]|uniref:triggering receptor expressed on myeloid cells 2 n=1 Tax=Spea bombifrons TaxID=233779 RepID=UPI00234AC486|nr:triggering receptor expressed on myeloid cells 2 [Spea bombifrons]
MTTHLTVFSLMCVLGVCFGETLIAVSAQLGDTVTINCPYQKYSDLWRKKIWCKQDDNGECHPVASTWLPFLRRGNNNTNISDNIQTSTVTVNMTLLQSKDAGIYQCQSVTKGKVRILQKIIVNILEDTRLMDILEMDKVHYSISRFPLELQNHLILIILGISLLLSKLLLIILISKQWMNKLKRREKPEPLYTSEELVADQIRNMNVHCDGYSAHSDERHAAPLYMNYMN